MSLSGNGLRNPHHVASHNNRQFIMGALVVYIELDIGKIYDVQFNFTGILRHETCQIHHLLFCPFAGIRWRMKINGLYLHTTFCHHISRHRAVNSTRQKKHGSVTGSHRHTARSLDTGNIHIRPLADFHINLNLRMVHIHFGYRHMIDDIRTGFHTNFRTLHLVIFIASLRKYFKGKWLVSQFLFHMRYQFFADMGKRFVLHQYHRTNMSNTKHVGQSFHHFFPVEIIRECLHIDTPLLFFH